MRRRTIVRRSTLAVRLGILAGAAGIACWGTGIFSDIVLGDGFSILDIPLIALFVVLYYWLGLNFLSAALGFVRQAVRGQRQPDFFDRQDVDPASYRTIPRTAVAIPVYNEDPGEVFAGIEAMHDGLARFGLEDRFVFFVLSDTTRPEVWAEEEAQFVAIRRRVGPSLLIRYRRRPRNVERKSGNVEDFIRRWGRRFRYMIVLDADSTMSALTMAEMVKRMEADPRIGILQVPPVPAQRRSFFARLQQFSSALYGGIYVSGFHIWSQNCGNYYGHNAIIRIRAFARHCKLPHMPGRPPLGGEILSHDFVEAALIHKAGHKVILADDLPGSYEECPTTLRDFAIRDQRWCQGNLQHLRLVLRRGFYWVSRLHLFNGAMAYMASPLWALFLVIGILSSGLSEPSPEFSAPPGELFGNSALLLAVTFAMLFLPKFLALLVGIRSPWILRTIGGLRQTALSVVVESAVSVLTAPIMMIYHTAFVLGTFTGHTVKWDSQNRTEAGTTLAEAFRQHSVHTISGLVLTMLALVCSPVLLLPLLPITVSLLLSAPIAVLLSRIAAGDWLRERGLLLTRYEVSTPFVLSRKLWHLAHRREERTRPEAADPIMNLIRDPVLCRFHLAQLESDIPPAARSSATKAVCMAALYGGSGRLSREELLAILTDPRAIRWMHRMAWRMRTEF